MSSVMKNVFVGMSGGVDSSVSAGLLKQQGYAVTGVFIKTWHPDFLPCTWREEREDAMRVCAHLGIPFETLDLESQYKQDVADYMIHEYHEGRTPNPDVMCNQYIKFGAFFDYALHQGANCVATGHYARLHSTTNDAPQVKLLTGVDTNKDQSYFLYRVPQAVLQKTIFPIGTYTKSEVRILAKELGLANAEKKDSQGVCFLGHVEMREFLKRYITVAPGDVLDKNGTVIGRHEGAVLYTIGQRHGFVVTHKGPHDGPYYVASRDTTNNTLVVSQDFKTDDTFTFQTCTITDIQWVLGVEPSPDKTYQCRFRYRQPLVACTVETDGKGSRIQFTTPQRALNPGQSLVVYDGELCLGGGIIV